MENLKNDELFYRTTTKKIINLIEEKQAGTWHSWVPSDNFTPKPELDSMIETYCKNEKIEISRKNYSGNKAPHFNMKTEQIYIPKEKTDTDTYYSVIFHELSHSTGTEERLNRPTMFMPYAMFAPGLEEIIAELSCCFLCLKLGIDSFKNNLAYIKEWCNNERLSPESVSELMPYAIKSANFILERSK